MRELDAVLAQASDAERPTRYGRLRDRWFERLLGPEREADAHLVRTWRTSAGSRRSSVDVHEGARDRGLPRHARRGSASTSRPTRNIRLDLEDRPQKSPRACVIASDPPQVVHLITRAQGGLHDYQAFLHEAGHALHYAGSTRPADHVPPDWRATTR